MSTGDLVTIALLLMCARSKASAPRSSSPMWPLPSSPPPMPPMPGTNFFEGMHPSADTGTPLADVPAVTAPPPKGGAGPTAEVVPTPTQAFDKLIDARDELKQAIKDKFTTREGYTKVRRKGKPKPGQKPTGKYLGLPMMPGATFVSPSAGPPIPPQMNVTVADLQSALLKRGVSIRKDGLYGPKTEAAWAELAHRKKLSPMINRVTSKIARVARDTYLKVQGPAIP